MVVFTLLLAALLIYILQLFLSKNAAKFIEASVIPSLTETEPDTEFDITLRIINRSRLPLSFIKWTLNLPAAMNILSGNVYESELSGIKSVSGTLYLLPRRTSEIKVSVSLPERGLYRIGTLTVKAGDFLGISETAFSISGVSGIVAYPKPAPLEGIEESAGSILGDISVRRYIYEDPVLISGFREYTGNEPMKNISWLQTARTGSMYVKKFDYTARPTVTVVMNTALPGSVNSGREALLEKTYSLTRSVCQLLEDRGIEYDFYTNAPIGGSGSSGRYIASGMGDRHFRGILSVLGRCVYGSAFDEERLLEDIMRNKRDTCGMIIISPHPVSLPPFGAALKTETVVASDYIREAQKC